MGLAATHALGGKPRSLDVDESIEEEQQQKSRDAKSALKDVNTVDSSTVSLFVLTAIHTGSYCYPYQL